MNKNHSFNSLFQEKRGLNVNFMRENGFGTFFGSCFVMKI